MVISERKRLWGIIGVQVIVVLLLGTYGLNQRSSGGVGSGQPPLIAIGSGAGGSVAGQAAIRQVVEGFVAAQEIDEATGRELLGMMLHSESNIEAIPDRIRAGELLSSDSGAEWDAEMEHRRSEMERLLGEDLAGELGARLEGDVAP